MSLVNGSGGIYFYCTACDRVETDMSGAKCNEKVECETCEGKGYSYCETHKRADEHYYCSKHSYVGTSSSHVVCEHDIEIEHDYIEE